MKVLDVLSEPIGVEADVSPPNDAVKVYELEGSPGVMTQVAVPVLSVLAVQVSEPLSVKVTGSSTMGVPVFGFVSTAETGVGDEKLPETGWMASVDGSAVVDGGGVATSSWSSTDRPKREPEPVLIVCMTAPVAMLICQMSPELASPVQKEVPLGSTLMAKSPPAQPVMERAGVGLDHVAVRSRAGGRRRCRPRGRRRWPGS